MDITKLRMKFMLIDKDQDGKLSIAEIQESQKQLKLFRHIKNCE